MVSGPRPREPAIGSFDPAWLVWCAAAWPWAAQSGREPRSEAGQLAPGFARAPPSRSIMTLEILMTRSSRWLAAVALLVSVPITPHRAGAQTGDAVTDPEAYRVYAA